MPWRSGRRLNRRHSRSLVRVAPRRCDGYHGSGLRRGANQIAGAVGSSYRLRDECAHVAKLLELPLGLDPESEDVWSAEEEQGISPVKWRRYGVESRVCLVLHHAADLSIRYGSAIVFA